MKRLIYILGSTMSAFGKKLMGWKGFKHWLHFFHHKGWQFAFISFLRISNLWRSPVSPFIMLASPMMEDSPNSSPYPSLITNMLSDGTWLLSTNSSSVHLIIDDWEETQADCMAFSCVEGWCYTKYFGFFRQIRLWPFKWCQTLWRLQSGRCPLVGPKKVSFFISRSNLTFQFSRWPF